MKFSKNRATLYGSRFLVYGGKKLGGKKKKKKKNTIQPQIDQLNNRISMLSEKIDGLSRKINDLSQKLEKLSTETLENHKRIEIILRAKEILKERKKPENPLKTLLEKEDTCLTEEDFLTIVQKINEGVLNLKNKKTLLLVSVVSTLSKIAKFNISAPHQRTFWKLVDGILEIEKRSEIARKEAIEILRVILNETDLLNRAIKPKRSPKESIYCYYFNENSKFYKKLLSLLSNLKE